MIRRPVAAFFAVSPLFAVLVGCSSSAGQAEASPTSSVASPTSPSAASSTPESPTTETNLNAAGSRVQVAAIEPGRFTGQAVAVFGQELVDAGYAEMAAYAGMYTFNPDLMPKKDGRTYEDFAAAAAVMTPTMAEDYRRIVESALSGEEEAQGSLQGISWYGMSGEGVEFAAGGPLVVNHQISKPRVSVDRSEKNDRLVVAFSQRGDLRVTDGGEGWLIPLDKSITFYLEPAAAGTGRAWSVDGYDTRWRHQEPVKDTNTY